MRFMAFVALGSVLLAGCGAKGDGKGDDIVDEEVFGDTEVESDLGVIRGIVLDPTLAPVEGATVALSGHDKSVTTDSNGVFVFLDLEPGPYFLHASKPGWTGIQQSVEVVAGVDDPEVTRIMLEKVPGTEPRAFTQKQEGFISCSIGTPATIHDCNTIDEQKAQLFFDIQGLPTWIQTELQWESTQPAGDWLYVIQGVCTCEGNRPSFDNRFNETPEATSVYIARATPEFLASHDAGGANGQLMIDVSASGPEPQTTNGSGIALNQDFVGYATMFYNFDPDPTWSFVADGEYPVPPS
jgi:hypothetical protein